MRPYSMDEILPISELEKYSEEEYSCVRIVFDIRTEVESYIGCPPYLVLCKADGHFTDRSNYVYFEIPKIFAERAKKSRYTPFGERDFIVEGKALAQKGIK